MQSIDTGSYPLVFPTVRTDAYRPSSEAHGGQTALRTICRALGGMQKEAIVQQGANGPCWRMLSDEGPWLKGSDLAPFPLAFFTAGLIASYLAEYAAAAAAQGLELSSLALSMDNRYGMEGSATEGTMRGSALPVDITFKVNANAGRERLLQLAYAACGRSAADAYLRSGLQSRFTLTANGARVDLEDGAGSGLEVPSDPLPLFSEAQPDPALPAREDIIEKCAAPGASSSGTAVGLKTEQKRQVHVHGDGFRRADGLNEITVACIKPAGSLFRFLSDDAQADGRPGRAPCGLAYLSAGLSFCFMTQLGRYAQLAKQALEDYRLAQDTYFTPPAAGDAPQIARAGGVDTHVFLDSKENDAASRQLVRMGHQTCYLHAAAKSALRNRMRLECTDEP